MKKVVIFIELFIFAAVWGALSMYIIEKMEMPEWMYVFAFTIFFISGLYGFLSLYLDKKIKEEVREEMEKNGEYTLGLEN